MRTFGASAPYEALKLKFGFTAEHIYQAARRQLAASARRRQGKADA
jgi:transketolase